MGVAVRRYIDVLIIIITFPYSTCISSFLAAALFIFKMIFRSCLCLLTSFCAIYCSKCCSKNIRERSKIEIT